MNVIFVYSKKNSGLGQMTGIDKAKKPPNSKHQIQFRVNPINN